MRSPSPGVFWDVGLARFGFFNLRIFTSEYVALNGT